MYLFLLFKTGSPTLKDGYNKIQRFGKTNDDITDLFIVCCPINKIVFKIYRIMYRENVTKERYFIVYPTLKDCDYVLIM